MVLLSVSGSTEYARKHAPPATINSTSFLDVSLEHPKNGKPYYYAVYA